MTITTVECACRALAQATVIVDRVLAMPEGERWSRRGRARLERCAVDALRGSLQLALAAGDLELRALVREQLARLGRNGRGHRQMRVEPPQNAGAEP